MSKIEDLTLEIKKYTTIYNDILVGMHADINDYKKKVTSQASKTTKAVNLFNGSLQEIKENNLKVEEMTKKVFILHSEALEAKLAVDLSLAEYKKESKTILTKLNHLESNITQLNEELTDKVTKNHKELNAEILKLKNSNISFKIVALLSFLVIVISVGYLLKITL